MIVAGTGHRPYKLGGYNAFTEDSLLRLAQRYLVETKPMLVTSGMALGWDTALAEAALLSKIALRCAVPFNGQELGWNFTSQKRYREILSQAVDVIVVCPGTYSAKKMQVRNEWMVDHANRMVALYNGDPNGGTANCINYALKRGLPIDNLWERFKAGEF